MTLTLAIPTTPTNIPIVLSRSQFVLSGNTYALTEPYATGLQIGLVVDGTSGLGTWTSESPKATSSSALEAPNSSDNGGGISRKSGMGSGAKIGIGVAVPVVAIILASIFAFICVRRRKTKGTDGAVVTAGRIEGTGEPALGPEAWAKPELQGDIGQKTNGMAVHQKAELHGLERGPPAVLAPLAAVEDGRETTMPSQ